MTSFSMIAKWPMDTLVPNLAEGSMIAFDDIKFLMLIIPIYY